MLPWFVLLAIACGVVFSFLFALKIVSIQIYCSNDSGNSTASYADFFHKTPLEITEKKDGVKLPPYLT